MRIYKILVLSVILAIGCKSAQASDENSPVVIYTIGDSTMANKPNPNENPERGWVQVLAPPHQVKAASLVHLGKIGVTDVTRIRQQQAARQLFGIRKKLALRRRVGRELHTDRFLFQQ